MLVLHNAKIYTQDPVTSYATAIAIDHGRVIAVGSNADLSTLTTSSSSLDAGGRAIIPGLTDSHIHLDTYALSTHKIDCETATLQECLQRVALAALTKQPGEWVHGHGWNQNNWSEEYGTRSQLDEVSPTNPVYLTHKSLHCSWANSIALNIAGIDRHTPDPQGGRIGRLPNGDPDGILFESAMDRVERVIPEPTVEEVSRIIKSTIPQLWKMGLTGVHDFDHHRCFSALQLLHQNEELKFRVVKSIPGEGLKPALELGLRTGFGDDMLRIGSVKLFSDGALGPHTAAMFQPYDDDPTNLGVLMMTAGELVELSQEAIRNGLSLAVHAIGDRANHEVLDAYSRLREYEATLSSQANRPLRHRIEHVQVLQPADLPRFHQLNIIASMQPIHATSDMLMSDRCWGERSTLAYAWKAQLAHQSQLIFGSDAPVESPNPFVGIHAAVTRRRADGSPSPEGWYPQQKLTITEALHAYTTAPAFAAGMEGYLGRLSPGYLADLLILDRDPYTCLPEQLLDIHPIATMINGDFVYSELS